MIKNKKFIASVHVSSLDGEAISLWNSNTKSYIDIDKTHHSITIQAEDKHEVRRQVAKRVRELQSHLTFGEDYTFYINQIWEK